jgi:hypothetical protein
MDGIPETIREVLTSIGRAVRTTEQRSIPLIEGLQEYRSVNFQRPEFWQLSVLDITNNELIDLLCGLNYVESESQWPGGSVSGVIWLFQALEARGVGMTVLDDVFTWIIRNTSNPFNQVGSRNLYGAGTYSDFLRRSAQRDAERRTWQEMDADLEQRALSERQLRREMAAAGARARNTEVRTHALEMLEGLSLPEQLAQIASHPIFPPQFFPASIANAATADIIGLLPHEVQVELARRLKGKRKGPWARVRTRLLNWLGPIWNKRPW